ncbi:2,3-bisphosphoglycerate-dependent phosphoglycerate mutase [Sulfurimonas sp. SWIR-19]|uniref:2,3-bisphosphoglycerate-dependent phosphoglycerate mutase n=1 Tax=Sulfurimonas sp. SWIR-19 TaxID=2878390 RepID=UPI001CF3A566|nr:2,3-bisphosphoglycerate-dependent phosphoglycerate mutase [Sulfurimonas sp. SWIR-19]UCN00820.1 2,3-bisphosphoglycerate-dependent phosphoglycerate mutase [Sulfurimonas sp. SWIR-19]
MDKARLVLVRHGQSIYNQKNIFTGWTDVDLSQQGRDEAKKAGQLLKKHNIYPDICFTSWLKRAIHTAQILLQELEWEHINMLKSYKLNERHYGDWQGRDKDAVKKEYGEEKFLAVRRGYDVPPPPLHVNDKRCVWNDKKYANIDKKLLPLHESLKDTKKRVLEYYTEQIIPQLQKEKTVLISAHGNSLRALVMELEKMTPQEIVQFEIPTGEIIMYDFDSDMQILEKNVLIG